ncbi:hypothetical protein [Streptomyces sp. MAR4 CNX-425]|uniref:hypothetical protein n=1 Tax=Streptomyces sp. MAR4 CNX-425 TaxID=3406343 RepID=UPI003B50BC91
MRPFAHYHERELLAGPGFLEDRTERRCPACGNVAVRTYAYRSFQRAAPSIISYLWCASCRRCKGWTGPDLGRFELPEPLSADDRDELRGAGMDALFRRLDALWEEGTLPQQITLHR